MKKITCVFYPKGNRKIASARMRVYEISEKLNHTPFATRVIDPALYVEDGFRFKRLKQWFGLVRQIWSYDSNTILIVQRVVEPTEFIFTWILGKYLKGFKVIFDFDDASYLFWPKSYHLSIRFADKVFAGSHALQLFAGKINPNVAIIPTALPIEKYHQKNKYDSKQITIGWIGYGPGHRENLTLILPPLKKIFAKYPNCKFRLIGAADDKYVHQLFKALPVKNIEIIDQLNWNNINAVSKNIAEFDIGIMPLTDDEFSRGKCAFKLIEYMACRVPAVASKVGENSYIIKHGQNGFLVSTQKEWFDSIEKLIINQKLREKLGQAGRKTIQDAYSYQSVIPVIKKECRTLIV